MDDRTSAELDLIRTLEQARRDHRWWQNAAIAAWASFAGLFAVSLVQFAGTIATCRLVEEAKQEAAAAREASGREMEELRRMHAAAVQAGTSAVAAERNVKQYVAQSGGLERLDLTLAALQTERKALTQAQETLRKDQIMINGRVYSTRLPAESDP